MARLIGCSSCSTYILPGEASCPFCGARQRSLGRAAGAVAIGLALSGCGDDGTDSETIDSAAAYGVPSTSSSDTLTGGETDDTESSSSSSGSSSSESGSDSGSTSTGGETDTDSETDTDTGGTTLEPDYGVPTTSG